MIAASNIWLTAYTGIELQPFLLICLIVFSAAFLRGLTGFGYALLAVPFVGLVSTPAVAVVMAILMQVAMGPIGLRSSLRIIDIPMVLKIAALACLTTPVGLWLLDIVSDDVARLIITGIAIGSFLAFMVKRKPDINLTPLQVVLTGASSGILNGFAAMPGPPVVLQFVRENVPPAMARSSMITIFFATSIMGSLVAFWRGMVDERLIVLTALSIPFMIAGNQLGARFFGAISEPVWRSMIIILLGIAGAVAFSRLF